LPEIHILKIITKQKHFDFDLTHQNYWIHKNK